MKFFSCLTIFLHFFIFTSTIKVINAIPIREFKEITSDEIKKNHLQLKKIVDNCYNRSIGYFDPQGEPRPDFDFKKAINLAAVGFQWVIVTEENNWITDFQVLESSQKKPLIVSNTSAYQWNSAISNEEDFHMISWPRTGRLFYSFELIKKKLKQPGTVGDLYQPYFRDIYRATLAAADNTINAYVHSLTQLTKKRFRDIKANDLKFLKVLENVFDITLIYYNNRKEPSEFFSKSGRRSIEYLLEEICKKEFSKKKLYIEEIVDPSIIEKDKEKYLLSSPSSLLSFYSYLIDIKNEDYQKLTEEENLIKSINHVCGSSSREETDIFHSEPLLSWIIDNQIRRGDFYGIQSDFEMQLKSQKILSIFPIAYVFSERQTCPLCEGIIQKYAAVNQYIPLIAFNASYNPDYLLMMGTKFPLREKASYPSSEFASPFSLTYTDLRKIMEIKQTTTTNVELLKVNYDMFVRNGFSFLKRMQDISVKKLEDMRKKKDLLTQLTEECKEDFKKLDSESPVYKILFTNNLFQKSFIELLDQQIVAEEKMLEEGDSFIKNQDAEMEMEEKSLIKIKSLFQRIPIQYRLDNI